MIRGKVVWITGGSSGIGAATAAELAGRGARVAITARRQTELETVASSAPGEVIAVPGDVRDPEALKHAVIEIESRLGHVDVAMLNAGIWEQMDVSEWDSTPIRTHIETNLMGMVNALDAVLPGMLERRHGRIVGVASVAGYRGFTRAEAYGTTKAAEINLLESLRIDLSPLGVRVQTVNPGFVDTPMTRRNRFPMPFITDAPTAAKRIADGIEKGKAETVFPVPYMIGMKLLRVLPVRPYTWISTRMAGEPS
jgi:NAD(P)-dependent dehydrogenase (short-subunit alcohol dehydrogenase family)